MPLVYQHNINAATRMGVWHITEAEEFFLPQVPLQRAISHPHKRLQHLAGRILLHELFPDFPVAMIEVADTRKPFLPNDPFHFSISHCGNYAAVVVSRTTRVGVDIETVTDRLDRIRPKFLSPEETAGQQFFSNVAEWLTLCWSAKEAVYKWSGTGGVDFKKHMVITDVSAHDLSLQFRREGEQQLRVNYLFFGNTCLSWVLA